MERLAAIARHLAPSAASALASAVPVVRADRLAGKVALITGAGSGIGRASALRFAAEGASLFLCDWNEEAVAETARLVQAAGGRVQFTQADAGSERDTQRVIAECIAAFGSLDIFFANAGVSGMPVLFTDASAEDMETVFRTNVIGVFLGIKHAALAMKERGIAGAIICTASVAGIRSGAGGTDYSASKAAVINLVQTTANQLSGTGIRVNAICPGLIETGMTSIVFESARARGTEHKIGQLNPLRRYGHSHEIASVAAFLASADASYVNGQAIAVDGGLSSSLPVAPGKFF